MDFFWIYRLFIVIGLEYFSKYTHLISYAFGCMGEHYYSIVWCIYWLYSIMSNELSLFYSFKIEPLFDKLEFCSFCFDDGIKMIFLLWCSDRWYSSYVTCCSEETHDWVTSHKSIIIEVDRSRLYTESYLVDAIHISITPAWMENIESRDNPIYREIFIPFAMFRDQKRYRVLSIESIMHIEEDIALSEYRENLLSSEIFVCGSLRNIVKCPIHIFFCLSDILCYSTRIGSGNDINNTTCNI